jgi:hypothetical protein
MGSNVFTFEFVMCENVLTFECSGSTTLPCSIPIRMIRVFCLGCGCRTLRVDKRQRPIQTIKSSAVMERVQADCVSIKWRKRSGGAVEAQPEQATILVVQDHFSRYVWLRVIDSPSAQAVAQALVAIFVDFGCPSILHTDNGPEFRNALLTELQVFPIHPRPDFGGRGFSRVALRVDFV